MSLTPAFWDSSAVVPLCVAEKTTAQVTSLGLRFSPVVWWGCAVETHGAFARLRLAGQIDASNHRVALRQLAQLESNWQEIAPSDSVRNKAKDLLDAFPLRAADSLQLAAALIWCNDQPTRRTFISSDIRLCEAATQAGFSVLTP